MTYEQTNTGVIDDSVAGNPVESNVAFETPSQASADHTSDKEMNFRKFREEIDQMKNERNELRQQLELLRANQYQSRNDHRDQHEEKFLGKDDDEYISAGELKRILMEKESETSQYIQELAFAQTHTDYNEVIDKYTKALLKEKPHLYEGIDKASNKALHAYELGLMYKNQKAYEQMVSQPSQEQTGALKAQKMVENARRPATLSGAGGSMPMTSVTDYASMPREQFLELYKRNMGMH